MKARRLLALASSLAFFGTPACSVEQSDEPAPVNQAPTLDLERLPSWPPIGADTGVTVNCTDDSNVSRIEARFNSTIVQRTTGKTAKVLFTGRELGSGLGSLLAQCCDDKSLCSPAREIRRLLVDLTPPEIAPDRQIASPYGEGLDGEISVWVADAWLLGAVELTFGGTTLRKELPHLYPATLGKEWDVSRMAFAAKDLPPGSGLATVVAIDAAGNRATSKIPIRVDSIAPTVTIRTPAANSIALGGRIPVQVFAEDGDNPTAPTIEIAGGLWHAQFEHRGTRGVIEGAAGGLVEDDAGAG